MIKGGHGRDSRERSGEEAFKVLEYLGTDGTELGTAPMVSHSSIRGDSLCYSNKHPNIVGLLWRRSSVDAENWRQAKENKGR